jgi:processive 1,2-diacylglycerol beta-glucosyltransferase
MTKRVMIISVSAGAGHLRAAEALEVAFNERHPDVEIENIDAMQYVTKPFKKMYADSYLGAVNHMPILYGYIYEKTDKENEDAAAKILSYFQNLNARRLIDHVEKRKPAHVICVHYLPAEILAKRKRKGKFDGDISVVVTDYGVHQFWIIEGISNYFVGCDTVAWTMKRKGIDERIIHTMGIPIHPIFLKKLDKKSLRQRLGLDENARTVMILSGGFGVGGMLDIVKSLLSLDENIQVITVAGRNEKLKKEIDDLRTPVNVKVVSFGFVRNIDELMAASDIAISKPGGLSSSECLAKGLPMIIIFPIPGQEQKNSDYLLENQAALKADTLYELEFKLGKVLRDPKQLASMRENASRIARPEAAYDIADFVHGSLGASE